MNVRLPRASSIFGSEITRQSAIGMAILLSASSERLAPCEALLTLRPQSGRVVVHDRLVEKGEPYPDPQHPLEQRGVVGHAEHPVARLQSEVAQHSVEQG